MAIVSEAPLECDSYEIVSLIGCHDVTRSSSGRPARRKEQVTGRLGSPLQPTVSLTVVCGLTRVGYSSARGFAFGSSAWWLERSLDGLRGCHGRRRKGAPHEQEEEEEEHNRRRTRETCQVRSLQPRVDDEPKLVSRSARSEADLNCPV